MVDQGVVKTKIIKLLSKTEVFTLYMPIDATNILQIEGRIYNQPTFWDRFFKMPLKQGPVLELSGDNLLKVFRVKILKDTQLKLVQERHYDVDYLKEKD